MIEGDAGLRFHPVPQTALSKKQSWEKIHQNWTAWIRRLQNDLEKHLTIQLR